MKLLEKILVATEFSQSQTDTLQTAVAVARTFHSEVLLVHVIPEIHDWPLGLEDLKATVNRRMQSLRAEITPSGILVADPMVAVGSPFDQIIELADLHDVNVIIVGSGENGKESQFRLGLTAEKLIRKANKPVWVVKAGAAAKFNTILCPVDFSDPAGRALTNAIRLARTFQAHLEVLTVIQSLASVHVTHAELADQAQAKYVAGQQQHFDDFLAQFDFHNVRWNKTVRRGLPHEEILKLARESGADLLVMGSTGRTGVARILMGSVAEKVIRELPCPVITVKSEHAIRLRVEQEITDLETEVIHGRELLEAGLAPEALRSFQHCVGKDMIYAPAWDGLAAAHERLGHAEESERCKQTAKGIRDASLFTRIEAEVRAQHPLWGKKS